MNTKKLLALAMCAVLLVVSTVFVTVAFLTSQDDVTNTFTVGNVVITLDEADVDTDGKVIEGADRVKENKYKLIPGHNYVKDPTVHVGADSEDCYLFVTVDNGIANIEAEDVKNEDGTVAVPVKIATQMEAKGWYPVTGETNVYYYGTKTAATAVSAGDNIPVFGAFTVDGGLAYDDVNAYVDETIVVNAYAIQKDGMNANDPAGIWGSF